MARGDVFAFTDTIAGPCLTGLRNCSSRLQTRHVGAVGGAEQYDEHGTVMQQAIHICMTSSFTTGGLRGTAGKKLARYYPRTFNMAISREAFEKAGGFNIWARPYHGEDIESELPYRKGRIGIWYLMRGQKCFTAAGIP